jgi:hypothetical protein
MKEQRRIEVLSGIAKEKNLPIMKSKAMQVQILYLPGML